MTNLSEKQKLAEEIYFKIDNEGLCYYFLGYGADYDALKKLGFDIEKIKKAVEGLRYLDSIYGELEEMSLDED